MKLEWPVNGGGVNTYDDPDELYAKAQTLIDSFFYLSHTWDHPCDLDNGMLLCCYQCELLLCVAFRPFAQIPRVATPGLIG